MTRCVTKIHCFLHTAFVAAAKKTRAITREKCFQYVQRKSKPFSVLRLCDFSSTLKRMVLTKTSPPPSSGKNLSKLPYIYRMYKIYKMNMCVFQGTQWLLNIFYNDFL